MAYEMIVAKFTPDEPDERVDVVLPDEVVGVGAKAFRFKGEVRSFRGSQNLIEVGDAAFDGCRNLAQVDFPGDLAMLGKRAFQHCTSLREVVFSESLGCIDDATFQGATALSRIVAPGVVEINRYAFQRCTSLVDVQFGALETIGRRAFAGCTELERIVLPDTVKVIGEEAFSGCQALREVVIPEGVEEIGPCAFRGCASLDAASIPDSVVQRFPESFTQEVAARAGVVLKTERTRLSAAFQDAHEVDRAELMADGKRLCAEEDELRKQLAGLGMFARAEKERLQERLDEVEGQLAEVRDLIDALDNPTDEELLAML
ncbi:leucine-rich repeat domain-containing protein [uncultured Ellagibacter sp.]|uniref:leucine-rich repeat domain-containing protein n=1 Tax=uncultured Ellagibacter sp. TaxID=2137580 RepID=UPI0026360532|nr:leucine-rich repeat domain-containing protein [uncultured Ellagibacter sp.]